MSTNLFRTLRFISDIQLVPLKQARLLDIFPDKKLMFNLSDDLDIYRFSISDTVKEIYKKYFKVHNTSSDE